MDMQTVTRSMGLHRTGTNPRMGISPRTGTSPLTGTIVDRLTVMGTNLRTVINGMAANVLTAPRDTTIDTGIRALTVRMTTAATKIAATRADGIGKMTITTINL